MAKAYNFDISLKELIDLVDSKINKACEETEHYFEWLNNFTVKAKQKLRSDVTEFKMPKTPARKMTRQQKKRVLYDDDDQMNGNHSSNNVPLKKGKLSHENDDLSESLVGRPRRQASCAAKSKIQQCSKVNLRQKLRRPSGEHDGNDYNTSSIHDAEEKSNHPAMDCGSPVLPTTKLKQEANNTITIKSGTSPNSKKSISSIGEDKLPPVNLLKVNFAPEPTISHEAEICEPIDTHDEPIDSKQEAQSAKIHSPNLQIEEPVLELEPTKIVPPKKVRTTRKGKKVEEVVEEVEKIVEVPVEEKQPEDPVPIVPIVEQSESKQQPDHQEDILKKKTRKVRKAVQEKTVPPSIAAASASTRLQKTQDSVRSSVVSITQNSPRIEKTTSKRNLLEHVARNMQFGSPNSSPVKKVFTPKLVFSPFKASSVKTKVEAFEAALGSGVPGVSGAPVSGNNKAMTPVLPEARVLLKRLTDEELNNAGAGARRPSRAAQAETNLKRGTIVLDTCEAKAEKERKSVAQILARKSVDKAKYVALSAARNKLLNSVVQNETSGAESPNVHVNRNAANIMSKFRFNSGSSSSSVRSVAMTQGKTLTSVVTGVGTFTSSKPLASAPTKPTEEDENKRKEVELKRLKEKEEEAARKREELIKAKAEEQKRKHEARAKRAMEQRMLRAKQLGEEQKQKLENKEEKSAHLKQKLLADQQEKAERYRAALLQKQQEAEQRRKAEELQKLQELEEEKRLQTVKKEQEELERQAKLKQAEAEKATTVPTALNTTVTLPSSLTSNYQITPVRVTKTGKLFNPDNYDIGDMRSDDSTDDDSRPKKVIPSWARSVNLKVALAEQAKGLISSDDVFPAEILLKDPNLNEIFKIKRARFNKRTSSAVWKTPPAHYM